jgi:predicted ATPase
MITKLRVQNFKCLRDVTLGLGPLTVLIGPNDSGKSSLLDALYLLCRTTTTPDLWSVFQGATSLENLRWRRERALDLRWGLDARVGADDFTYTFELTSDGTYVEEMRAPGRFSFSSRTPMADTGAVNKVDLVDERDGSRHRLPRDPNRSALGALGYDLGRRVGAWPFLALLQTNGRYRLSTDALRSPSVPTPGAVLSPTGDNLAAVVDAILGGPDRDARVAFETALEAIIPTLRGVTTPPAVGGSPARKKCTSCSPAPTASAP